MKTKIYCLRDENRALRYVGKTVRELKIRLKGHLEEASKKTLSGNWKSNTNKSRWIRSMLRRELSPIIDLITEVNSDGNKAEIAYITFFRRKGIKLVNGTDGGDGGSPGRPTWNKGLKGYFHHSEAHKKRISLLYMGHKVSTKARKKISSARKGKIPWNKGKPHSDATRVKLCIASAKRWKKWHTENEGYNDKTI